MMSTVDQRSIAPARPGRAIVRFDDAAGRSWHATESFLPFLDATILPNLGNLRRIAGAQVVKATLAREVVRIPTADGGAVFAKRYWLRSTTEKLKYAFVASRAFSEWRTAHRLAALRIPCALPLAVAERRRGPLLTEAFYFCAGIDHAEPYGGFLESRFRADDAHTARKLAQLEPALEILAQLHAAGIYHSDFHGGNLLARDTGGAPQAFLIDLHSIHDPGALFDWMRTKDLADLLFSLRFALSPREQLDAARQYGLLTAGAGEVMAGIARVLAARARRHLASRSKRCFKDSSLFTRSQRDGWQAYHRRDVPLAQVLEVVGVHQLEVERGGPGVLSLSPRARVSAGMLGDRRVVVKEFIGGWRLDRRARRAYHAAHALGVRGISAPLPLALLRGSDRRAYVISQQLHDAVPLTFRLSAGARADRTAGAGAAQAPRAGGAARVAAGGAGAARCTAPRPLGEEHPDRARGERLARRHIGRSRGRVVPAAVSRSAACSRRCADRRPA
ncbi:MAG: lipopolysaccharide kinase InaA family protein [Planctomycetota bacterium]